MISRKRVRQESQKKLHLDLFSPAEAHFESPAVTTNKALSGPGLRDFITGRDAQEKPLGERKGECALDVVPTNDSGANSAWQQLSLLAHNLGRSFQVQTLALPKPRSRKRTTAYTLRGIRTLRFRLTARAGRLARIGGRQVLRLSRNPATEAPDHRVIHALAA